MTDVAVLRINYGDHDELRPLPEQDMPVTEIVVNEETPLEPDGFIWMLDHEGDPRMQAKGPRCRPDWVTNAPRVMVLDAHLEVRCADFVRRCCEEMDAEGGSVAAFPHPFHRSIEEEALLAATLPKYEGWPLLDQAEHYVSVGHPPAWGLWAAGVMVRRPAASTLFGDAWLAEIERWGPECQISMPVAARLSGTRPVDLPIAWWGRDFRIHCHRDGTR